MVDSFGMTFFIKGMLRNLSKLISIFHLEEYFEILLKQI